MHARGLFLALFVLMACAVSPEDDGNPRFHQISQAGVDPPTTPAPSCTSTRWHAGDCDAVFVTPFPGVLTGRAHSAYRSYTTPTEPGWTSTNGPPTYVYEYGRLHASPSAGNTVRIDMWALRNTWRSLCRFADQTLPTWCVVNMYYFFEDSGDSICHLFLEVSGDPTQPNTVMPYIRGTYRLGFACGGSYASDPTWVPAYAVYYPYTTPTARALGTVTVPGQSMATYSVPSSTSTIFGSDYPYWHSP